MAISIASLALTVVPVFFIGGALQGLMGPKIAGQGDQFFAFLLVGTVALSLVTAAVSTLPGAVGSGISSGFFEMLLMSPARRTSLLVGLSAYGILWTILRGLLTLAAGWLLGARIAWGSLPGALLILIVIVATHWAIGVIGTALILAYRTMGPLPQGVLVLSALFGGTYYPTHVIPSWLQNLAAFTPLAYGLRALRGVLLEGKSLMAVGHDLLILLAVCAALLAAAAFAFGAALRHARRVGSLNLY
jgi:ABC-type multidrug transport system permease subunit